MTNIKVIFFSVFLFSVFIFPQVTYAHILKTDGTIGAVLHVDPNDNPVAGKQAGIFLEFKDTQNKFQGQNCDCQLIILKDNQQVFTEPLFQSDQSSSFDSASTFYTFPEPNVYQIVIAGKPQTPQAFQEFRLSYDIRVEKGGQDPQVENVGESNWFSTHAVHLIGAAILILFLAGALVKQRISKTHA